MNKSVLILDTPKDCGHCLLSDFVDGDTCLCRRIDKENKANDKPSWCPLRPLPHSKQIENRWFSYDYSIGWNDCLDEITGENKKEAE